MIQKKVNPGKSVLFALIQNGKILCEEREWDGHMMHSIPGGKIEKTDPSQEAALFREMKEEFDVLPAVFEFIGDIRYNTDEWVFHVWVVTEWEGNVPAINKEDFRQLSWLDPRMLKDNQYMPGVSDMMRNWFSQRDTE